MLQCKEVFTYVSHKEGRTQDGECYFAINVIDKQTKAKMSFLAKNPTVIDTLRELKFIDFQDVRLIIRFNREYSKESRYHYWKAELIGIERNNAN